MHINASAVTKIITDVRVIGIFLLGIIALLALGAWSMLMQSGISPLPAELAHEGTGIELIQPARDLDITPEKPLKPAQLAEAFDRRVYLPYGGFSQASLLESGKQFQPHNFDNALHAMDETIYLPYGMFSQAALYGQPENVALTASNGNLPSALNGVSHCSIRKNGSRPELMASNNIVECF